MSYLLPKITQRWRAGKESREKAIGYSAAFLLGWLWCTFLFGVGLREDHDLQALAGAARPKR
jgi:hypothetical protein